MADELLIWGAGAIGGTIGAFLALAGHRVRMVDTVAEHAAACSGPGLAIEGPVDAFTQVVPCVTPDRLRGRYGRIVLAVKAQDTDAAVAALRPHLADDGYVLSAQNGLNEAAIAARVGSRRTIGAFVNFGADWLEPGRILYGNRGAVVVGEIDGVIRDRTRTLHALLRDFEPDAVLTDDIHAYLWGKMGYGAMLYATALTHDSMAANFADPARADTLIALAREVMAVASAIGVAPRGFNGFDPAAFRPGATASQARASLDALAAFNSKTAKTHSGIWRDLAVRRRKTEANAHLGALIEEARRQGVATPVLNRLLALITEIETGGREQSADSFAALAAATA